jgi:hypothetical protein
MLYVHVYRTFVPVKVVLSFIHIKIRHYIAKEHTIKSPKNISGEATHGNKLNWGGIKYTKNVPDSRA